MQLATSGDEWELEALGSRAGHIRSHEVIPAQTPLTSWIAKPVSTACQANAPTGTGAYLVG